MADDRSASQRSETMRRVRSKNTSCEVALRSALHRRVLRYRLGYDLPGSPDIAFVAARTAVFVDGCFWHGCPEHCRVPTSNRAYWRAKIARNCARDARVDDDLRRTGWRVVRVWEHEIKHNPNNCAARIAAIVRRRLARAGSRGKFPA